MLVDEVEILLETWTLDEILEMSDLTQEDALRILYESGHIKVAVKPCE